MNIVISVIMIICGMFFAWHFIGFFIEREKEDAVASTEHYVKALVNIIVLSVTGIIGCLLWKGDFYV